MAQQFIPKQKPENVCPHKKLFTCLPHCLPQLKKKMGATEMSTNYWIHKYSVTCSYSGISCSIQNDQALTLGAVMIRQFENICYMIEASHKDHEAYGSIYMKCP